jgi:hypothetical protein
MFDKTMEGVTALAFCKDACFDSFSACDGTTES